MYIVYPRKKILIMRNFQCYNIYNVAMLRLN